MEVLEFLKEWSGWLTTGVSALAGGGIWSAWQAYRKTTLKTQAQDHDHILEVSNRLEGRLNSMEERMENAEAELLKTRRQLSKSRIRRRELRASIKTLVERLDRVIERLAKYEDLSAEEREDLTSIPFIGDAEPFRGEPEDVHQNSEEQ